MCLSHSCQGLSSSRAERVGVYLVPAGRYCARVNNVQSFGDVNREVRPSEELRVWYHQACVPMLLWQKF